MPWQVNRGVVAVRWFACPRLWAWIIIAVRHYHCDVITMIMWRRLAPWASAGRAPLRQGRGIARVSSSSARCAHSRPQ